MAPVLETNVTPLERELILFEPTIAELLEVDDTWWAMLEKVPADPVSNRATRIPLLDSIKGTFGHYDPDDGDMGTTSGPNWIVATVQPTHLKIGYGFSAKANWATDSGQKGIKGVVKETFRLAMEQFRGALDMLAETGGNGVLGTITSVAAAVFTMTTDGFKVQLFYVGMPVQVFNAALTTDRGSATVTAIDRDLFKITVDAAPAGTVATDLVVVEGLAAPVTIQSSLFGKQYHQSDATSGLWMNLDRAVQLNIRTPSVNAASSALTTAPIRRALNKIKEYVGKKQMSKVGLVGCGHPAQGDAYEALAITISSIIKSGNNSQGVDQLFNDENMTMSGVPWKESIHADRTRIDFIATKNWRRVVATDTGFYRNPGSDQFVFPTYRSGGDGLKASSFFYLKTGVQIVNKHPLAGSFIKTLSVVSGY